MRYVDSDGVIHVQQWKGSSIYQGRTVCDRQFYKAGYEGIRTASRVAQVAMTYEAMTPIHESVTCMVCLTDEAAGGP